jgi:heptosyltransferase-2
VTSGAARILVVAPNWIGDALMAQPLLMRLRAKYPQARIDMLAPPWVAPVARRMPEVAEVLEADLRHGELQLGDRWRLGRTLRDRGYAQAYVLPNTMKSALAPSFARIPLRVGYLGESRVGLLNRIHKAKQAHEPMPLHYARLAEEPGAEPDLPLPLPSLLFHPQQVKATADRFGIADPYTVLCPGAEYGPAKRWPFFPELSRQLTSEIVVLGSAADRPAAAQMQGRNLVGQTTLDEAIDLIAGAAAVVSNDSGLMHVAAATGRPLVALFGSSSPQHTPPQSSVAHVLWLKPECSPCYARECPLGHFKCMNELSAVRVLGELKALS